MVTHIGQSLGVWGYRDVHSRLASQSSPLLLATDVTVWHRYGRETRIDSTSQGLDMQAQY